MTSKTALRVPDTFLILLAIALLAWLAQLLAPVGYFAELDADGRVVGESFRYAGDDSARPAAGLFSGGDGIGLVNFLFEGLVAGDRNSAAVGLIAFLLITGGAFGIILRTKVMERLLARVLAPGEGEAEQAAGRNLLIPSLFVAFSLMGAIFGMSEESIVFTLIVVPALVRAGYDSITGLLVIYVATQVGFATSWMNPFSVVIAQGVAGVPALSGMGYRAAMWVVFTAVGAVYAWRYAAGIRRAPSSSLAYASDDVFRNESAEPAAPSESEDGLTLADWSVLAIVLLGIGWIAWGVTARGYYLPEISAQFFAIGLAVAAVGSIWRIQGMTANDAAAAFREGAGHMVPAALVIGIAKGIVWLLGGDDPTSPSVLNTLLHVLSGGVAGLSSYAAAASMYLFQSVMNLFIVSGSGQAALTMPLMAPLADLSGLSRQIAVLAFQLGDGLTNLVVPASAALMGCLGAARLEWTLWVTFVWKLLLLLMAMAVVSMMVAVAIGFS